MANAAKIQADYDQLEQIAAQFTQHGDRTLALGKQIHNCMSQLQNGGWIGVGANRFYNEMDSLVMPAMARLANALNTSGAQTERIAQLLRTAEEEAAYLFQGSEGAYSGVPATSGIGLGEVTGSASGSNAPGGGMNLGGMIGMAVGGILGGPVGAMLGARIGNAIGSGPFSLNGALSIAQVAKESPFTPISMFNNYIGNKPNQWNLGHEFSSRHLFGKYTDGAEDQFINRSVDVKAVLAGGELWGQRAAVLRGDLNFQAGALSGNTFGELLSYDTSGEWEASIGRNGASLTGSAQLGAYLGRVGVTAEMGGLEVAAQAYAGAHIRGEVAAVLMPGQAYVGAGGELFVGGKAEASASYTHQVMEGLSLGATVNGYVSYGLGAQADVKFGYDEGKIHIGGTVGATLGVGMGGSFEFTIDAKGIVDQGVRTVQEVGRNIADFGRGALDIIGFAFSR